MSAGGGTQKSSGSSATDSVDMSQTVMDMFSKSFGSSFGQSQQGSSGASFGQGSSDSFGTSESFGQNASSGSTFVDPVQQQRLQALYGAGGNLMGQQGNMQQVAQGIVNPLMAQGQGAMKTLTGLQDVSGMVNAQTQGLQSGLARLGLEQRNQIGDAAGNQGAFGGSRHGIAEGVAQGETNRAFQEGYGDILSSARQQAGAAAGMQGNLAPILANLGMMPSQAAWNPLQQMKNLIGGPTVLSQQSATGTTGSTSEQRAKSSNLTRSLQESFGWSQQEAENFAESMTRSRSASLGMSQTRAKNKGSAYNANFSVLPKTT